MHDLILIATSVLFGAFITLIVMSVLAISKKSDNELEKMRCYKEGYQKGFDDGYDLKQCHLK